MLLCGNQWKFWTISIDFKDFLENFFKKLEYCFLVESTKIKNASFPYKTVTSEANVKTNSMVSTKWSYHKERNCASNYFFLKVLFRYKNIPLVKSWVDVPTTQVFILLLFVSAGVLFNDAFTLWVSLAD